MDNTNPSSSLARTLGDFLPEALQEAGSERDGAPPLNDSHFANLGGGRGGTVDEVDVDRGLTGLALAGLVPGPIDRILEETNPLFQLR